MPKKAERIEDGEYIVADPRICHGALTFKGTRIFVRAACAMRVIALSIWIAARQRRKKC